MDDFETARQMVHVRWIAREQGVYLDDAVVILLVTRLGHDPEGLDIHTRAVIANSRMMGHGLSFAAVKAWVDELWSAR